MVLVANFCNVHRTIPKHIVLGYAMWNRTLLIPLLPDSSLVAHVH